MSSDDRREAERALLKVQLAFGLIATLAFALLSRILFPRLGVGASAAMSAAAAVLLLASSAWPLWLNLGTLRGNVGLPIKSEALRTALYYGIILAILVVARLSATMAVASLASSYLITIALLSRRLSLKPAVRKELPQGFAKRAAGLGWRSSVSRLLEYGSTRLDALIIGALLGSSAVGAYSVAFGMAELLTLAANANVPAVIHGIAERRASNRNWITFLRRRVFASLMLTLVGVVLMVLLARTIVTLAFGPRFIDAVTPLRILSVGILGLAASRMLRNANFTLGRAGRNWVADLTSISMLVVGDLLFVPRAGLIAAALVSLAASYTGATILAIGLSRSSRHLREQADAAGEVVPIPLVINE